MEIGLHVLSHLAASGAPTSLTNLARRSKMSPSQTYRYLASLVATKMARQDPATGYYDLASGALQLGLSALMRLDVFAGADEAFAALSRKTGRTCLISVWGDAGPIIVRWYPGIPPVITPLYIGSTLPLLQTAAGHVFFAFGNTDVMEAAARREIKRTGIKVDLKGLRRKVRQAGGSAIDSIMIPGLHAAAAPIFDLQGQLALVGTAVAPVSAGSSDGGAIKKLHEACRQVTEGIGGKWAWDGGPGSL